MRTTLWRSNSGLIRSGMRKKFSYGRSAKWRHGMNPSRFGFSRQSIGTGTFRFPRDSSCKVLREWRLLCRRCMQHQLGSCVLLSISQYQHLKRVALELDGTDLRIGTTCSGSDICIVAIHGLMEAINAEFWCFLIAVIYVICTKKSIYIYNIHSIWYIYI